MSGRGKDEWGARGEGNRMSILTEVQVREIKLLLRIGEPLKAIAKRYGVSVGTIGNISTGRTWKHVKMEEPHDRS